MTGPAPAVQRCSPTPGSNDTSGPTGQPQQHQRSNGAVQTREQRQQRSNGGVKAPSGQTEVQRELDDALYYLGTDCLPCAERHFEKARLLGASEEAISAVRAKYAAAGLAAAAARGAPGPARAPGQPRAPSVH